MHVASELALLGRTFDVQEARSYGLVNMISKSPETLVDEAVGIASQIAYISPDAIVVTREALREVWESPNVERAFELHQQRFRNKLYCGENAKAGLAAFAEKRAPRWVPPKLYITWDSEI
jgi:enoyl-CoA hydratase/carnithine racemase